MLLFYTNLGIQAQGDASPEIEEISVGLSVTGVGSWILPSLIDGEGRIFLPVADIFSLLRIKIDIVEGGTIISGYLPVPTEERPYRIDGVQRLVQVGEEEEKVDGDEMIVTEERLYLRSDLFGSLFGLHTTFNFRDLEVRLNSEYELPAIRDMKRELGRKRLRSLTESPSFDRRVENRGSTLKGGVLDWQINGRMNDSGVIEANYAFNLGAELLGGGLRVATGGRGDSLSVPEEITWNWHHVDNSSTLFRQVRVGHISGPPINGLNGKPVGLELTNRSTLSPLSFGTFQVAGETEPEWEVELYVDNYIVDFAQSDLSGNYQFEIPVGYGTTPIELRFFGPYGEEISDRRTIRIPHKLLPTGEFNYSISTGLLTGEGNGGFAQAEGEVGLGTFGTIGGGVSGLYDIRGDKGIDWYPAVNGTFRLNDNMFLSTSYTLGTTLRADFAWMPSERVQGVLSYEKQTESRKANQKISDERYRLEISAPLAIGPIRGGLHGQVVDKVSEGTHLFNGLTTFATRLLGIPTTLALRGEWNGIQAPDLTSLTSSLKSSWRIWEGITLRPSVEYNWLEKSLISCGIEGERRIASGLSVNVAAIRNMQLNRTTGSINLRWDFSFARTTTSLRVEDGRGLPLFGAGGSIAYDSDRGTIDFANRGGLDRASLTIHPFLDLNNNGARDPDEPAVPEADVALNGGLIRRSAEDSTIHILNLEPHRPYILTFGEAGLPDISWRPKYKSIEVTPRPHRPLRVDLPITVGGEVSGQVIRRERGQGGMIVHFRQLDGSFSDSTITDNDGQFYYMGLPPGEYAVELDGEQVKRLGISGEIARKQITIRSGREGDIVEGIELVVSEG